MREEARGTSSEITIPRREVAPPPTLRVAGTCSVPPAVAAMSAERLEVTAFVEVMSTFRDALAAHQDEINRLNVFPVPDGDTGTNMMLTLDAVLAELAGLDTAALAEPVAVTGAIAKGSLMGARGNSGVILCQVLRGLVQPAASMSALSSEELASALLGAASAARAAVLRPVEGTILSVADAAATRAMSGAAGGEDLETLLHAIREAAREALWATPSQLPVLADAGVVDAGGAGLLLLFDALVAVTAGMAMPDQLDLPESVRQQLAERDSAGSEPLRPALPAEGIAALTYEVMFFLDAPDDAIEPFKDRWGEIGDSIVVVGGEGLWNCHVHTDDIGAAIEAAIEAGRPRQIRVTDLQHQVEEEAWVREAPAPGVLDGGLPPVTSVVAVATGTGIREIFSSLGADRLVAGGQSMNPSTAEILAAAEAAPGRQVVVLPNNSNIFPVAEQVVQLASKPVFIVRTKGVQEGFAALLAYDPAASGEDNARLMHDAAAHVIAGEVTRAVRAARTEAGAVNAGDWIGLSRGGIESVGQGLAEAAIALLRCLIASGSEIVTLIAGAGAPPEELAKVTAFLAAEHAGLAVEHLEGGQPLYPLLISIE